MRVLLAVLAFSPLSSLADILTVDFVKVLNGNNEEALYYYENNWKRHRVDAAKRGYIGSFQLLVRTSDEGETDILLITEYGSDAQYQNRESNFAVVMSTAQQAGPLLLNDKKPGEFREVVDGAIYTIN